MRRFFPISRCDFEKLYETLEGKPVTIRFLDPPLHEFVPTEEADIEALAALNSYHRHSPRALRDIKAYHPFLSTSSTR